MKYYEAMYNIQFQKVGAEICSIHEALPASDLERWTCSANVSKAPECSQDLNDLTENPDDR